ncbi:MAG: hypothetical protein E6Q36_00070 [Chryseobacterium sp.]|nr:MAG: hypothetical protein E6Q36_00070 [Chryseobacterium sp.]
MAPIGATITVNFTSQYAGPHRVCWRIGNSGPYDCSTIVNCLGGGNPCSAVIPVTVDNSTCDPVDFNGYIQAACEVESSLNNRIPFSVIFTPVQPCDKWDVTCTSVDIPSYTITNPGAGYVVGSDPIITVVGGGGAGAAAHGVVGNGGLKTLTITNGGAGYNGGGSATFLNVPAQNIVGAGVGALLDVTVTAGVITAVTISTGNTDPGTGYAAADTFDFNNINLGGSGAGAIITVNTVNTGEIQYVVVDNAGSGYSSVPVATVAVSPILRATVTANLGFCPGFDFGNDCDGNAIGNVEPQPLAFVYKKCSSVAPTPPAGWVVAENGCCYDCVTARFTASGVDATVSYTDCATGELVTVVVPVITPLEVCVVNNSWYWDAAFTVVVSSTPGCP